MLTISCSRCGIEFHTAGPICPDCVDVLADLDAMTTASPPPTATQPRPQGIYTGHRVLSQRRGRLPAEVASTLDAEIRRLNALRRSDKEIAELLGVGDVTIWRRRNHLRIPAISTAGVTHWRADNAADLNREYLDHGRAHRWSPDRDLVAS
ncbi:hypothetical protein ACR8AL_14200 [Clavibacter sepedonicus]|uniref:hypothetical protein n=1 Tax=Clavibacter TaxID=1573 RepID=UPI0002ED40DF|nr:MULTISPECIES: hypothetical protein [Clavibacter]MBD5383136.1 hypothetical protein [Clavibacter sp.]UUK67313.1 hypothetical protein LRE50_16270 [Clavibacter sepedonicus]